MGGFFGAVSQRDVTLDIFFGVDYHSHLGTRRGGMIMFDEKDGFQRQIHNIENTPFRTKFEKDLADFHAARGEEPFILGDKARLADGRAHLDIRDLGGTGLEPQRLDAGGDRARTHEQHLQPHLAQFADAVDDAPQRGGVGAARLLRD